MAKAIYDLPYDNLVLENWGDDPVDDPPGVLAEAALDAALGFLTDNATPMYCTSRLSDSWAVCDPEDADAFMIDIAALRDRDRP